MVLLLGRSVTQCLLLGPTAAGNLSAEPGSSWASTACAVPGQDRLLRYGSGSGASTLAVWERLRCQRCHFPLQNVRRKVRPTAFFPWCLRCACVCFYWQQPIYFILCGGVSRHKDKRVPEIWHIRGSNLQNWDQKMERLSRFCSDC